MKVVTAHDGAKHFIDMATVAQTCASRNGYDLTIESLKGVKVKHTKPNLIMKYFGCASTVIWMDTDSMFVGSIDSIFERTFDVALVVKPPETATARYGHYLHSGFIVAHNTHAAINFLCGWGRTMIYKSDQRNLNLLLAPCLDDSIYNKVGEVVDLNGLRVYLLDPNIYVHTKSIEDMVAPPPEAKIIHFKGKLQKDWPEYKRFLC